MIKQTENLVSPENVSFDADDQYCGNDRLNISSAIESRIICGEGSPKGSIFHGPKVNFHFLTNAQTTNKGFLIRYHFTDDETYASEFLSIVCFDSRFWTVESDSTSEQGVARALIGGGGGVYIHIFRFCPTSFFWNKVDFKRRQSGRTRIYEYTPPPPISVLATALHPRLIRQFTLLRCLFKVVYAVTSHDDLL